MLAKVPAYVEQLRARHAPTDWTAVVRATATLMQAAGATPLLTAAALANIEVPVQILVGDADHTTNNEAGAALAAQLPQGRYEVLPNTPHPLERVDLRGLSERISGMRRITDAR